MLPVLNDVIVFVWLIFQKDAVNRKFTVAETVAPLWEVFETLLPLFTFVSCELTLKSMEELSSILPGLIDKLYSLSNEDFLLSSMNRLHEKVKFALWCFDQLFVQPNWSPKKVLELCVGQSSNLNSLKLLGGLHLSNEVDIPQILTDEPLSLNIFKGFSALIKFVHFLFKCFQRPETTSTIEEVEKLVGEIDRPELRVQVMENMFALIFLRREYILFEETASESGEEKKSRKQSPSNSNSPNSQSQTGTSSTGSTEKKDNISFGFLCQDPDKLEVKCEINNIY